MTTVGYTKTLKPVRDWSQRIWRLLFDQQLEITGGLYGWLEDAD
jgi:hypothetical protein